MCIYTHTYMIYIYLLTVFYKNTCLIYSSYFWLEPSCACNHHRLLLGYLEMKHEHDFSLDSGSYLLLKVIAHLTPPGEALSGFNKMTVGLHDTVFMKCVSNTNRTKALEEIKATKDSCLLIKANSLPPPHREHTQLHANDMIVNFWDNLFL